MLYTHPAMIVALVVFAVAGLASVVLAFAA